MSILVTGGAGFIGSHCIERLLAESRGPIICLDNFNDYYDPRRKHANLAAFRDDPRVTILRGDFCDTEAMVQLFAERQVKQVIHLGAYAGVRRSVETPELYERTNVGGTLALLEAARKHPVERFLLASSSTVYGDGASIPFREDQPLGIPLSPYGASKRAAELLGLTYWRLHRVPVVCLRFFSVYGPRLRPDLALTIFAHAILDGLPIPLFGDGSICRDFTYIDDILAGLFAALDIPAAVGQEINLGHHEPLEMRLVIQQLAQELGMPAKIDRRAPRPEDLPVTCADLTKAGLILGYSPQVSFEEGIREFAEWVREMRAGASEASAGAGR